MEEKLTKQEAKKLAAPQKPADAASYTLKEFCARHSLSKSQYHRLRREGRGPRTMKVGPAGLRISAEAERDWIRAREEAKE
jgi:hypothetical protein